MSEMRSFFFRNKTVFSLGFVSILISSLVGLVSGVTLGYMTDLLAIVPALMLLITPAIGVRGSIFGAVGSRLGTAVHMGTFELSFKKGSVLRQNVETSIILTIVMAVVMGAFAKLAAIVMGIESISLHEFIFISVMGGTLSSLVLIVINVIVAVTGFKHDWDLDNISAPIITAAGDIVTMPMLFATTLLVINPHMHDWLIVIFSIIFVIVAVMLILYVLLKKKDEVRRIFVQSIPTLLIFIIIEIVAGSLINNELESFIALPALLIMVSPFLGSSNSLGGILTSRFSSYLHMGLLRPKAIPGKLAFENFAITYVFGIFAFVLIGVATFTVSGFLGMESPPLATMIALSLIAGMISTTILCVLAYYLSILTFRLSLDPDDHSIPLITSMIDVFGVVAFVATILLLGLA
ncbi:magnesium transporter [Candidatus Methanomassiliicoccus intestinalis]|uniref:magnesium transporter n=1 Tax=Candidatus Methanomassiliicoccus intestinalis TaxID=1406512 RepID=UPI0037DC9C22